MMRLTGPTLHMQWQQQQCQAKLERLGLLKAVHVLHAFNATLAVISVTLAVVSVHKAIVQQQR